MLKQQLQQKLQQKLSPQQIQLIRLLELPAIELEERVKHELEDNPALEEGKEPVDDFERTESEEGGEAVSYTHLVISYPYRTTWDYIGFPGCPSG